MTWETQRSTGSVDMWASWRAADHGDDHGLIDHHEVWFTDEFIQRGSSGDWEVDWSRANCQFCQKDSGAAFMDHTLPPYADDVTDGPLGVAGVIIRHTPTGRVWKLNGQYNFRSRGWLGIWPD